MIWPFSWFKTLFSKKEEQIPIVEEGLSYAKAKKLLRELDELILLSESSIDKLVETLDSLVREEQKCKLDLKALTDISRWKERSLLLKIERIHLNETNLQQRIEIFNQNIRVYMNVMSHIQDSEAMRMAVLESVDLDDLWLEFSEKIETYKEKLSTGNNILTEKLTQNDLDKKIISLRKEIGLDLALDLGSKDINTSESEDLLDESFNDVDQDLEKKISKELE